MAAGRESSLSQLPAAFQRRQASSSRSGGAEGGSAERQWSTCWPAEGRRITQRIARGLMKLAFRVVTDPVAKARPRASFRGGKALIYTPANTKDAEWRIRTAFCSEFPDHEVWAGPVTLVITAWLSMPKSIAKKRRATALPVSRPDCDNYLKTVLDALNGVAFADDSQVVTVTCSKRYVDGAPPAWEISLSQEDCCVTAYEHHRLQCIAAAEAWERAAETARTVGKLILAGNCAENAKRLRWLAEPDEEVAALFDAAQEGEK